MTYFYLTCKACRCGFESYSNFNFCPRCYRELTPEGAAYDRGWWDGAEEAWAQRTDDEPPRSKQIPLGTPVNKEHALRIKLIERRDEWVKRARQLVGKPHMGWAKYSKEIINSTRWRNLRREVYLRDGDRCRLCNGTDALVVHHRSYEHVGEETLDDLTLLCADCHDHFHKAWAWRIDYGLEEILTAPGHQVELVS